MKKTSRQSITSTIGIMLPVWRIFQSGATASIVFLNDRPWSIALPSRPRQFRELARSDHARLVPMRVARADWQVPPILGHQPL